MTAPVTEDQWRAVRDSVRATAGRFCDLVASVPDPAATASAGWSVADVTAHVTTISFLNTMLMGAAEPPFEMPGLTEAIAATTVDTVHGLNDQVMSHFLERDVSRLLDTLRHQVGVMLTASREHDPEETFSWLGEARPTLAGMFAHMVNELLIHGNDIASAVKVPWEMPAPDAALFFDLFYVGLANGELGRLLDGGKRPRSSGPATPLPSRSWSGTARSARSRPGPALTLRSGSTRRPST
jgi:uncharacterized protein (TIGR03083 family)